MDTRRLDILLRLSRTGSMREVGEELGVTTSTVSQQVASLARDVGTALVEPAGRGVRLTPAGRRLSEHAVTILAAVHAAEADLEPAAHPVGTVRVAGFATAIRRTLLPCLVELSATHPDVRLEINEHEPLEALVLLERDQVDLVLSYDYNLAPAVVGQALETTPLWTTEWGLGVPASDAARSSSGESSSVTTFEAYRDHSWVVNSRNTADEDVVRLLAAMAGFTPEVVHRVDSLGLVQDVIASGLAVGLLPVDPPARRGVAVHPLHGPDVVLRAVAVIRRGSASWGPLAVVRSLLAKTGAASSATGTPS